MTSGKGLHERALIGDIFAPLAKPTPGALSLQDDAAFLKPPAGKDLIITADTIVAGVHFIGNEPANRIAAKALRVNLSDLAAKGARPLGYMLCLALNDTSTLEWVREFASGLKRDQDTFDILLYGGDTVKTPGPVSISITAFGTVDTGVMVRRTGAKAGDQIYVSGTIGDGALGLGVAEGKVWEGLSDEHRDYLLHRYQMPQPRCALAPVLTEYASASMDVSDGLIGDIGALAGASQVSAEISLDQIPLSAAALNLVGRDKDLLHRALGGGDDYEIVCTIPADVAHKFEAMARDFDIAVTKIGVIISGTNEPQFYDGDNNPVTFLHKRFEH